MKTANYHLTLASRLLAMAAAEFHERGCNDVDPAIFKGVSVRSRVALLENFNEWHQAQFHVPVPPMEFTEVRDDQWMSYLAWKLSGEQLNPQF